MRRRSGRLLLALRPAGPALIGCMIVCQLLAAALIPLMAWATGLVVAQVSATGDVGWSLPLITALAAFVIALWLGESVLHALWLVQATVARKVDGAVRSEVRLLLGRVDHLALVEDPDLRDDIAHVMSTGGARGYEESIGTGTWAQLMRWFDVVNLVAVATVLVVVSPWFAAAMVAVLLALRWALQRTWDAETEAEADGARGLRRTAYWTGLGTEESVAKEVRIFGMGDWVAGRRRTEAEDYLRPRWRLHQQMLRLQLGPAAIAVLGGGLAVGIPAWRAAAGDLTAAQLATALVAGLGLISLTGSAGGLGRSVAYGHVVLDALDRIRARLAPGADRPLTTSDGSVELRGVGFAYGEGSPVLQEVDLSIAPGEVLAVVGPNGAGKTTLMKLLAGLDQPSQGSLVLPPREAVAVLFSDFVRYPLTLADNVALSAPQAHDRAGVVRALELAGAAGLVDRLPGQLDTTLSAQYDDGVDLSGGQWQKVALARAIYGVQHGRRLLIMDEPTAHLDAGQEAEFYERVVRTLHGTTIVLVSHRLSTVRSADRIVLLQDGRITEQGSHADLMAHDGTYATMFRLQAERFTRTESDTDLEREDDLR